MTTKVFISCPLCGIDRCREIYNRQNHRIVRCDGCGFMYQNPRNREPIDSVNAEQYYRKEYLAAAIPHKKLFTEKFDEFLSDRKPGKVLDIGCATGQFIDVAREKGWEAVGIDISKWACRYLLERGYEHIYNRSLEEANFPENAFDAVHMSHVLEHVPEPSLFLGQVHRVLKPGGLVMIEVPNESRFPLNYRLINFLLPPKLPPRRTPASHLSLFTKDTLLKILKVNNLKPVLIRTEGFAAMSRTQTPVFARKSLFVRAALLLCRLQADVFLGLGRYLVAAAQKRGKGAAG